MNVRLCEIRHGDREIPLEKLGVVRCRKSTWSCCQASVIYCCLC